MEKFFDRLQEKDTSGVPTFYFFKDEHTAVLANNALVAKFILFIVYGLRSHTAEKITETLEADLEDQSVNEILEIVAEKVGTVCAKERFKDYNKDLPQIDLKEADVWTLHRLKKVLL